MLSRAQVGDIGAFLYGRGPGARLVTSDCEGLAEVRGRSSCFKCRQYHDNVARGIGRTQTAKPQQDEQGLVEEYVKRLHRAEEAEEAGAGLYSPQHTVRVELADDEQVSLDKSPPRLHNRYGGPPYHHLATHPMPGSLPQGSPGGGQEHD